jgi:GNAT superfamily N-acetyltransferase
VDYELIPYRPELRDQVVDLQQHLWGPHRDLNDQYLGWKHEANPYLEEPLIHLALHEDRVVAMRGFMGALWEGRGIEPTLIPIAGDLVVEPSHRAKGLVPKLMKSATSALADRGVRFMLNTSGSYYTHVSSLRLGWLDAGPLGLWKYENDGEDATTAAADGFRLLDEMGPACLPHGVDVWQRPPIREMVTLVERLPWDGRLRQQRDRRYLSWRFCNPRALYRVLTVGEGPIDGYLVLQKRLRRAQRVARIVDWEASSIESAASLLEAATRVPGIDRISMWVGSLDASRRSVSERLGFGPGTGRQQPRRRRQRVNSLLVGPVAGDDSLSLGGQDPAMIDSWDLRMIFSDAA